MNVYKNYFFILLTLLVAQGMQTVQSVGHQESWVQQLARDADRAVRNQIERQRERAENRRRTLHHYRNTGADQPGHPSHQHYLDLQRQQDRAERREEQWDNLEVEATRGLMEMGKNYFNAEIEREKIQAEKDTKVEAAAAASAAAQDGITERDANKWRMLTDKKNIMLWSAAIIGIPVTIYLCKKVIDYTSAKWGTPTLVKESSRQGFSLSNLFSGKKKEERKLDDVVLAPDIEKQAREIAERTKKKQMYGAPYANLLLYGPPGTGKTEFARTLAQYSGMDYAIIDGGSFGQFKKESRGVTEVNKLFDWAEQSQKGLLIFIDEADAFAPDRATITDSDERNAVNTFIARTGNPSTKYMIVFATNHRDALDSAVRSRLGKPIKFGMPELVERAKILHKKIEQHIEKFESKQANNQYPIRLECSKDVLKDEFLTAIAVKMKGFSGRDIEKAVIDMQAEALETDNRLLTQKMVASVVDLWIDKIDEDRKITADQEKKHTK